MKTQKTDARSRCGCRYTKKYRHYRTGKMMIAAEYGCESVFGLSYLLGIKLMPRIRNVKDLVFYRAEKKQKFKHVEALFTQTVDWDLNEMHWKDLMQVVLSIKAGKVLPSILLRRLGNYSRRSRLCLAYLELGRLPERFFC